MSERLDDFNKILLATGAINYMANAINGVNEQIKFIPDRDGCLKQGIIDRTELLLAVRNDVFAIMEKLADFMNDTDCICPIDVRATREVFKIVSGEADLTEK